MKQSKLYPFKNKSTLHWTNAILYLIGFVFLAYLDYFTLECHLNSNDRCGAFVLKVSDSEYILHHVWLGGDYISTACLSYSLGLMAFSLNGLESHFIASARPGADSRVPLRFNCWSELYRCSFAESVRSFSRYCAICNDESHFGSVLRRCCSFSH